MSNDDLQEMRGGFSVGGVNFNFGASVQTLVNGQLALQTNVQWTPAGAVVTQLQGLGTRIQAQVASTLANAGIAVPTTNSTGQPASMMPVIQTASALPRTADSLSSVPPTPDNSGIGLPNTIAAGTGLPTTSSPASAANTSSANQTGLLATNTTIPVLSGTPTASANSLAPVISSAPQTTSVASLPAAANAGTSLTGGSVTSLTDNMSALAPPGQSSNGAANIPAVAASPSATTVTLPVMFVGVTTNSAAEPHPSSSSSLGVLQNSSVTAPSFAPSPQVVAASTAPTAAGNSPSDPALPQASNNTLTGTPTASTASTPTILSGVQIQSPTGSTQVFANVANGQIQNIILNTASNQNIVQNTNLMLTIYNFASWQQSLAQHTLAAQLANQVLSASGFPGGH